MKKIIYYIAVIILVTASCTEDKGTYNYVDLNNVVISNVEEQYVALREASFSITPTVEQQQVSDESVLEYLWYSYASAQLYSADTLAITKNLDLESLMLDPKVYELVFRVTDTSSGIYYDHRSKLTVKGFPDGLQVLSNNADSAQVSILRGTGDGLSDYMAYKLKNQNKAAGTNPVSIIGINEFMRSGKPYRIAILCNDDNLGTYVTGNSLEKTINIVDAFQNVEAPASVRGVLGHSLTYATGIFGDNNLYTTYQPGLFGDDCSFLYAFPDVSPNFKSPIPYRGFTLYSPTTTGFGEVDSWGSRVTPYPPIDDEEAPFDRTNTGLAAIYGKKVSEYAMGVFEDEATNQRYILALLNKEAAFKKEIVGDNVQNATVFEFLNSKQVLLYAYGNKIYTYDVVANKVLYTYEGPAGLSVDCMEIANDDKKLFVGFGDGTNATNSGSVYILNIDLDGEILGVHEAYDNKFGKVVDFFENY
jgi:hypothetical protein